VPMGCQSRMLLGSALKPTSAVSGEQAVNPLDKEALLRLAWRVDQARTECRRRSPPRVRPHQLVPLSIRVSDTASGP
jgi:hypothetical protein